MEGSKVDHFASIIGETRGERKDCVLDETPQTERRVATVVEAFAPATSAASRALVVEFLAALRQWNRKLDLTAAKTEDELVDLFVADAAVLAGRLEPDLTVCDVGAGAGAPGFVLALLRPDLRVTLIEPLAKRTSFLRSFWGSKARAHAASLVLRLESACALQRRGDTYDVALSRATFEPAAWLAIGRTLLKSEADARVLLLHAKEDAPAAPGGLGAGALHQYVWPLTRRDRKLTDYRKIPA